MLAVDHQRADASEVYAELLARLRLEPLPEVEHLGSDEPTWSLRGVELRDAALAPDAGFVMALASFEYGAFARALRAPIFRKDVDGLCLVSDALSREIDGRSCLAEGEPFSVRLLPLLGARVQTIELTVLSGRCDGYSVSRGAHHELELWALQPVAEPAAPDALEKLLGLTTFDAWYTSPLPPLRVEETDVSYVGDPPQAVVADTRVTCDRWPEHSVEEECEASATHTEYRYVKGRYLSVP